MHFHRSTRWSLIISLLFGFSTLALKAQDAPTPEPPTATVIPTDIPPTPIPPPTAVPTETFTLEPSLTPLPPPTDTPVPSATDTASPEASLTPSETNTDAVSPTLTASPSLTATASASATVSLTPSITPTSEIQNQMGVVAPLANPIACTPSASIQQANVSSLGDRGDVSGSMNSLSSDGRYLYFPSKAANLVVNDTNNAIDYFEFDRTNCTTRRITVGANGEQGDADSDVGNVSGNGQYFAFASKASTFVAGDTNGKYDIFVKNLSTNAITRIPADPNNAISGAYTIDDVTISDDGRYLAFAVLVPAPTYTGYSGTPILYDTQTATRTVITTEGRSLYISGDGNYVAFASSVSNLVIGDTNNIDDIFLYQRSTGNFSRVSVATDGTQTLVAQNYYNISISSNGRYVAFDTTVSLVADDTNSGPNITDIYVRDTLTNQTSRASVNTNGSQFAAGGMLPRISADGRYVLFLSSGVMWVRDRSTNQTYQITTPYMLNGGLDLSADGSTIAFTTQSGTDPNITRDVYAAQRLVFAPSTPTPTPIPTTTPGIIQGNFPCSPSAAMSIASVDSAGTQGTSGSYSPNISATGRYIAFHSGSVNLVYGDTNGQSDVFVFDRLTCQTVRASVAANGTQGNAGSAYPSVSSNGRYVTFLSAASNLAAVDSDNLWDVFIKDLQTGAVTRLQTGFAGTNGDYGAAFIAGDDHTVVFRTSNTISLYDILTQQQTVLVTATNLQLIRNAISSDLRYLVFSSTTNNLVPNDTDNLSDVFLLDRQTSQTTRLSVSPTGAGGNSNSDYASISADGRYAVFNSYASNLAGTNAVTSIEVFLRDLQNLVTYQVSVSNTSAEGNGSSGYGSISDDGRYIAFLSESTNLVSGDSNGQDDVFVRDRQSNQTYLISRVPAGAFGNGQSDKPMMSRDGKYIAFSSGASNLLAGDTNYAWDVFVAQPAAYVPVTPTPTPTITPVVNLFPGYYDDSIWQFAYYGTWQTYSGPEPRGGSMHYTSDPNAKVVFRIDGAVGYMAVWRTQQSSTGVIAVYIDGVFVTNITNNGPYITSGDAFGLNITPGEHEVQLRNTSSDYISLDRIDLLPPGGLTLTPTWTPTASATSLPATQTAQAANQTATAFAANCATAGAAPMQIVSIDSNGTLGNDTSGNFGLAISDTGRYISFVSSATNLVSNDTNGKNDIFRFDRTTCQTIRISTALDSTQANDSTNELAMSADGQIIAFHSLATNLIAGDSNAGIFVRNLTSNTLIRIPNSSGTSIAPSISGDGRYITYTNQVTANSRAIILYDLQTNQSTTIDTIALNSTYSKISRDGSIVVYMNTNSSTSLSIYDRVAGQISAQSFNINDAALFDVSANGRYIVFGSDANNLVANDTNNKTDAFVFDRQTSQITRVSVSTAGTEGNNTSAFVAISPDGRYVTFVSNANNLVANDINNVSDVFVRDLTQQLTYVISANANGVGNLSSGGAWAPVSGDNKYIAFVSGASNLVSGDTNSRADVFVVNNFAYHPSYIATATAGAATATAAPFATQTAAATATYAAANGLVVNTTSNTDDGTCNAAHCSLVEAVNASNAMAGVQTIKFNIPGTGVKTIILSSSLILTSSAIIDGTTQPGYSGKPLIELVPVYPQPNNAIVINGANPNVYDPDTSVTIRGLAINTVADTAIVANNGQGHLFENNYIGTDATGTIRRGVGTGIKISAPNSIIRNNVLSGASNYGIMLFSNGDRKATNNLIVGNKIGTDVTGTKSIPNNIGIYITNGASNNTIGGIGAALSNVISGNTTEGIWITTGSPVTTVDSNIIKGNLIGLTASGDYLLGNGKEGVYIAGATNTLIGGATSAEGNQIWGNRTGIYLFSGASNTTIRNNTIVQNGALGIYVLADNTTIRDNTIAFHSGIGVNGYGPGSGMGINVLGGLGNRILTNSIYSNDGMGIKLSNFYSPFPNDLGDADSGPNDGQNYPVISSVITSGSNSTITGSLNSHPNETYHLEFFSNDTCPTGAYGQYGQGRNHLTSLDVTTNDSGDASFTIPVSAISGGSTFGENWSGQFFANNNLSGPAVTVNNINGLNFNWGYIAPVVNGAVVPGIPADNFSARFTSTQNFSAGTYTFNVTSDDGVRMYIDGAVVLDQFIGRPLTTDQFTVTLSEGVHTLTVEYFEGIDQALLQVMWYGVGLSPSFVVSTATDSTGNTSEFSVCSPVQAILGVGGYQETNPNLVPIGNWVSYTGSGPQNGSFKYTKDPNAKFNFYIDNTVGRITFYRTTHPIYGPAEVYMDGTLVATMNNASSALQYGVPFTVSITPGNHLIELRNKGASYISLDQVDLLPPAQALSTNPGTYQERNVNLSYSGKWVLNTNPSLLGQSSRYTNDPNASVSFNVDSSVGRVIIYRTTNASGLYGALQVFVDGSATPLATINNTSSAIQFGVPFAFSVTPGNHMIELRNVGSTYSDIDQIELLPAAQPLTSGGVVQETDSNLSYSGQWTASANASAFGGTWKYSNDPNATMSFAIDSSVGSVTIYRTTYVSGLYGSFQVFLDGAATPFVTIPNTSASLLFKQPFTFAVVPGNHVITLKNVGSTYSGIDQISLQAPAPLAGGGTYEEDAANLIFNGQWTANANASAFGGTWKYSNDPNATMSFAIDNSVTSVTIYRTTYVSGVYGSYQVFLDGAATPFVTIPNTSASLLFKQPFTFAITPGNHVIMLKNVGSTYSTIDQISLQVPAPFAAGGTYQEDAANLNYSGEWTAMANVSAFGGAWKYTNDPNASVNFKVDSSVGRMILYRTTYVSGVYGALQVFVDGAAVPLTTINNTSSALQFGVPFTFAITPGNHVITLKNVGSTYSGIDQIELLPAAQALTSGGVVQETDANLSYSGQWTANANPSAFGGTWKYSNDPNATVSFAIDSSVGSVTLYRTTYVSGVYGSYQVFLDGAATPFMTIPNTSASLLFKQPFTFAVVPGNHVITLKNVGSTYSTIDQISLQVPAPFAGGTYQEDAANLIYTGQWTANANPSAFAGTWKYSNDPNATVSFAIDSSVGLVTLYRTTYVSGVYGSYQVFLDGAATPFMTIPNTSASLLFKQPFTFAVVPGNHVITLKNVGSTYSTIDQLVLQAPAPLVAGGTYQEDAANLIFNGQWTANANASAFGGTWKYSNDPNATVSFAIDNSVGLVTLYRTTYVSGVYGSYQVFLDGAATPFMTIPNMSASLLFKQPFTFAVVPGNHVITFKNVGSTYSTIDQIVLQAPAPLVAGGTYQEDAANLIYTGQWTANANASAFGGTWKYSNEPNATVSFAIDNSVGSVTIYRTTYVSGLYGSYQVFLDGAATPFMTIPNTSASLLFKQPFTFAITPGNHVIMLKNVGSTYSTIDQIVLQP